MLHTSIALALLVQSICTSIWRMKMKMVLREGVWGRAARLWVRFWDTLRN